MKPMLALLAVCTGLLPLSGYADEQPLWQIGAGVATIFLPDYRGAEHTSNYSIPLPYFVYNGRFLKINESGVNGRLFGTPHMNLDLSLAGGVPVSSKDVPARAGMPNLDPTVEFGPALNFQLSPDNADYALWLRIPVRAVFSLSFSRVAQRGWVFNPHLDYKAPHLPFMHKWRLEVTAGPLFADNAYNEYFYSVPQRFARPDRPAYNAGGGYSGSRIAFSMQRQFSRLWVGIFARYDTLVGTAMQDSPLVETNNYFVAGMALTYLLAQSHTMVPAD